MTLRNRVDPWSDLHATSARGTFTGNRGCLVDDRGEVVRHHQGRAWIICRLEYKDWRHPLNQPDTWTPLFFLDEAVALAAGHRPCAFCRRDDFNAYRRAIANAEGLKQPPKATDIDARLSDERLSTGRGLSREHDRKTWRTPSAGLPTGTVIVGPGRHPALLTHSGTRGFTHLGWEQATNPLPTGWLEVLTPPTSVSALVGGYQLLGGL